MHCGHVAVAEAGGLGGFVSLIRSGGNRQRLVYIIACAASKGRDNVSREGK